METSELLRRIRRIQLASRNLTSQQLTGAFRSTFRGRGMVPTEVREYQVGDDVRDIDWNVTARTGKAHIKLYEQERELSFVLLVDTTMGTLFGTKRRTVRETIAEIAATIAFSACQSGNRTGLILFSDRVEAYVPPRSGLPHLHYLLGQLLRTIPRATRANPACALEFLVRTVRSRATALQLSGFTDVPPYARSLSLARAHHDLTLLRIYDPLETRLPRVGLLDITEAATGRTMTIDTADPKLRRAHRQHFVETQRYFEQTARKNGLQHAALQTDDDYLPLLRHLFTH